MDLQTLDAVVATGSKLEKEALLRNLAEDSLIFMRWALDPMITFGVTVDTDAACDPYRIFQNPKPENFWTGLDALCAKLASRELTGHAAADAVDDILIQAPSLNACVWACRILNKDLRAGFSQSTLNKAHPNTIVNEVPCALAKPYDPAKHEIRGAWCVEPKLDGLRMVVVDGIAYTRNGRTIDSVGHILKELEPYADQFVFDGEIMGNTGFDQDSGKIRKKGLGPNLNLIYNMFDCIPRAEWESRKTCSYKERRGYLMGTWQALSPKYIKTVPSIPLGRNPTTEELFKVRDEMIAMGYEGAMIKDLDSPYIFKRSDVLLKLKDFVSVDAPIVGSYEGKGKHKGKLGGIIIEVDGVQTRVGSGFSDKQREDLWARRAKINGLMVEVQYQNKTEEGSLRFPVFIRFRPDKD